MDSLWLRHHRQDRGGSEVIRMGLGIILMAAGIGLFVYSDWPFTNHPPEAGGIIIGLFIAAIGMVFVDNAEKFR